MNIADILKGSSQMQMPLNPINGNENNAFEKLNSGSSTTPTFSETLNHFVQDVNAMQKDSAGKSERFIKGEAVDMHDVMIAAEKAKTSFQLLMELRNKGIDLYKEAMRIQV